MPVARLSGLSDPKEVEDKEGIRKHCLTQVPVAHLIARWCRWTSNPKVPGLNPGRDATSLLLLGSEQAKTHFKIIIFHFLKQLHPHI